MRKQIDPALIDWRANTSKRAADLMLFRNLAFDLHKLHNQNSGKTLRILSLPAASWSWEQCLKETFSPIRFSFLGLEKNRKVWQKGSRLKGIGPMRMFRLPVSFHEYASQHFRKGRPFDVVYLDWMGTWSKEKKKDIEVLLKHGLLAAGGVLILTVSLRRGYPETNDELSDLSYDLPLSFYDSWGRDKYVNHVKVRGIPHWVENYALEEHEIRLRPLAASVYYSQTGLSDQVQPQLQLVFVNETDPR